MKPNSAFLNLPKNFWASVRLISQQIGYTERSTGQIKIPTSNEIQSRLAVLEIDFSKLQLQKTANGNFLEIMQDYFIYRADVINTFVEPHLMSVTEARKVFEETYKNL